MIKILFVIPEYSFGGTNKSLENLLSLLDKQKYALSLYCLYEDGGAYYKEAFLPYILPKSRLYYWIHDNIYTRKVMGLINKISKKDNFTFLYKYEAHYLQKRHGFDIVVAYQEGKTTEFGTYFHGTRRIAWVQCDYPQLVGEVRYKTDKSYYKSYDKIVCVSDYTASSFRRFFELEESKVIGIHNTLNSERIIEMSHENCTNLDSNKFNLVSIGRLHEEKQFDKIPPIVSQMQTSKPFCWYIIGSGPEEEQIKEEIEKYQLQNKVILLGMKDNPYPYIKNADLVVMTSRTESFSYVIAEAKLLHIPVLSTDFPVAYEVLDENCGWKASLLEFPELMSNIIDNKDEIYDKKRAMLECYHYSNREILKKLENLFVV